MPTYFEFARLVEGIDGTLEIALAPAELPVGKEVGVKLGVSGENIPGHRIDFRLKVLNDESLIPTLGICLGGGIISHALGAAIGPPDHGLHEFGYYPLIVTEEGSAEIPAGLVVTEIHYHGFDLPAGAVLLAASEYYPNQAYRHGATTYAFQFHPEITPEGFRRRQNADWAPWGKPGVQSREEQDALCAVHDPAQAEWIEGFLDRFMARGE